MRVLPVILLAGLCSVQGVAQQKIAVSGRAIDKRSGEPIPGASVLLKDAAEYAGAVADPDGEFEITVSSLPATIVVSFIGYKAQEIDIYEVAAEPLVVRLVEDFNLLNEVVVIGYGTQKKKEISGSVTSLSKANLETPAVSFDNLLSGAAAGVHVVQSSGQPGASSSVRIRGGNSITGGNEPLYVIDGFILYNDNSATQTGVASSGASLNGLATINPADIESMEVLKDASATAIYGSRGANGVILVTTRKGEKGADLVRYTGSAGWQTVARRLEMLDGAEWAAVRNDISATLGQQPAFDNPASQGKGTDWQDAALRQGATQNHQLSFSGGDDKTLYSISGNYYSQDGVLHNTDFARYSLRSNFERSVGRSLKVGLNVIASLSEQNGLSDVLSSTTAPNTFVNILLAAPVTPIYDAEGGYNFSSPYAPTTVGGVSPNPLADLRETLNHRRVKRTIANGFAEYKLLPGLSARLNAGFDLTGVKQNYFAPNFTTGGINTNASASVGSRDATALQTELTLTYDKTVGNHAFNLLGGYTTQKSDAEAVVATASDFPSGLLTYNSLQSGSPGQATSTAVTSVLNSWLGRVNYTFLKRYNVSLSFRADGSSRFSKSNKWGYFPSAGFSWNVNEERFFSDVRALSSLKVRLSAGRTGNQEIGDYQALSVYLPVLYAYGGSLLTGFAPGNLANPGLKWETTTQYNAGLDASLPDDRVNIVFDLYYKKTTDLLLNVPIPTSTGYAGVLDNIGSVSNKGVELSVNAAVVRNRKAGAFNWTSSFVIAHNRNEVLSLGDGADWFTPTFPSTALVTRAPLIVKVGEPLGSFWGYITEGIVQSTDNLEEAQKYKPSWITAATVQPGDRKYKDSNNDGKINTEDRVILGNNQPKFTYGFTNALQYAGVDLTAVLQGSYGAKLYNALRQQLEVTSLGSNVLAVFADRWTPSNPSNETPRATASPVIVVNDKSVEDASYLRLKSLTLGYALPLSVVSKAHLNKARIFFTGQNLLTLTSYTGYDPEANSYEQNNIFQGVDYGAYPSARSYLFGLELTF